MNTPDATCANAYVRVRTWNFADGCGNTSANFVQTITVRDTTKPVVSTLTGTLDATLECSDATGLTAVHVNRMMRGIVEDGLKPDERIAVGGMAVSGFGKMFSVMSLAEHVFGKTLQGFLWPDFDEDARAGRSAAIAAGVLRDESRVAERRHDNCADRCCGDRVRGGLGARPRGGGAPPARHAGAGLSVAAGADRGPLPSRAGDRRRRAAPPTARTSGRAPRRWYRWK